MYLLYVSENKLRKKWRYLRDQFAVEFGKIPPTRSGDGAIPVLPKWHYFTALLFLKDVVKPRSATGNLTRTKSQLTPDIDERAETADTETISSHDSVFSTSPSPRYQEDDHESSKPSTSRMSMSQTTPQQKKRPKKSINDEILHIEQQKLNLLQEKQKSRLRENQLNESNEHFSFFKSLMPHVEKIPQHMILSFRNKIQSVVEEFAYPANPLYNSSTYSSTSNYSYLSVDDSRNTFTPPNISPPLNPPTQSQDNQNLPEFYHSETNPPTTPNTDSIPNPSHQGQNNQNFAESYNSETNPPSPPQPNQDNQNLAEFYSTYQEI